MPQNIYLNSSAQNPSEAFVHSQLATQPVEMFDLVISDDPTFNLYVADGEGDFDQISGAAGYSVEVRVGRLNEAAVAEQTSWSGIDDGWTGELDLNTVEALALLGTEDEIPVYTQITITDPDAKPRTFGLKRTRLINRVLPAGGAGPTPIADYLTSVQTFNQFVQNRSSITGLTGGGALNLDGITTLSKGPGWMVAVVISGVLNFYQLQAGTTAESSPTVIRPDDYAAGTNEKIWTLLPMAGANEVLRDAGDPFTLGKIGQYDWQPYVNTLTGEHWNWNAPTAEWFS